MTKPGGGRMAGGGPAFSTIARLLQSAVKKVVTGSLELSKGCLLSLIFALFLTLTTVVVAAADTQSHQLYNDAWLDQRYDWVIHLEPKVLKGYLSYPRSGLNPVVNVKVACRVNPRLAKGLPSGMVPYEDLWYHDGQPIGCRRSGQLPLQKGWQGAVCVNYSEEALAHPASLANASVRMLLDVSLKNCTLVVVLVPSNMVSIMADELGRFNFFRTSDTSLGGSSVVHLLVSSGDPRDSVFLKYGRGN